MKYRRFGKTGKDVSVLSLGCMRYEDEESAGRIVARAVELGVSYFETSCGYCGGLSEVWLGKGLKGIRDKVMVSTKSAPGAEGSRTAVEVRRKIDQSLEQLGTDYLDFYHAWSVNDEAMYEACTRKDGWLEGVRKAMDEGVVKHVGITTHATPEHALRILEDGLFEVITLQYSLILQAYREVIASAHEKDWGVVLMGPLAGGLLAAPSPVLKEAFAPDDQVTGGFKYVLCDPAVSTASSGVVNVEQLEEDCRIVDSLPDDLAIGYQEAVGAKIDVLLGDRAEALRSDFCSGCRYCLSVCPENIRVFNLFKAYNATLLDAAVPGSAELVEEADKIIEQCTGCRRCEEVCPQKLKIPEHMEKVRSYFAAHAGRNDE